MSSKLVHIGVRASNLKKSIVFWRDALGLEVANQTDSCCDLTDGYHNFRVFQHNGDSRPSHVGGMLDYLHIGVQLNVGRNWDSKFSPMVWEVSRYWIQTTFKKKRSKLKIQMGLRLISQKRKHSGQASNFSQINLSQ